MKTLMLFISLLVLGNCATDEPYYDYDYTFTPTKHMNSGFTNISELNDYIKFYVVYKAEADGEDHWQYPHDTYNIRTGDCEDLALLKMCWSYYCFGVKGELYAVLTSIGTYHGVFYYDNYFYDHSIHTYSEYL
ncbi:MAG: hypothetical protein KAI88_04100, partial [Nitrosomonadaceae bacterium]|nr:hypothetical protein [Nitrosomonadaceae bacterium]